MDHRRGWWRRRERRTEPKEGWKWWRIVLTRRLLPHPTSSSVIIRVVASPPRRFAHVWDKLTICNSRHNHLFISPSINGDILIPLSKVGWRPCFVNVSPRLGAAFL